MKLDSVTDSHVEINNLDDTQEFLSNGLHKTSFDYDEDTAKTKILKQESQRLRLPAMHVYHPRRKAGCLLLLQLTMSWQNYATLEQ
jgi:hypothetical protein